MKRCRSAAALMVGLLGFGAHAALAAPATHPRTPVTGAGATFPLNMVEQWKSDFKKSTGVTIGYTGVGSGAGRTQLIAGTVDFAGSDVPATAAEAQQLKDKYGDFVYAPVTAGAVSVMFKIPGVSSLRLSGATLAKIFSGSISNWKDALIEADNGAPGPDLPIQVFVRSDKSGTTGVFTEYLAKVAGAEWSAGATQSFPTSGGQIGKAGSDGVASAVAASTGGIGYAEHSFAVERGLGEVDVKNGGGKFRPPDTESVTEAIDAATINADGTLTLDYATDNERAYPISTVSYVLAPTKMHGEKGDNLKAFLAYALGDGQTRAEALGYAPLPSKVAAAARQHVERINDVAAAAPSPQAASGAPPAAPAPAGPAPTRASAALREPAAAPAPGPASDTAPAAATTTTPSALARTGSGTRSVTVGAGLLFALGGLLVVAGAGKIQAARG